MYCGLKTYQTSYTMISKYQAVTIIICLTLIVAIVTPVSITQSRKKYTSRKIYIDVKYAREIQEYFFETMRNTTNEHSLPVTSDWLRSSAVWNTTKVVYGENTTSVTNETVTAVYPQGSYNPSGTPRGGFSFYASPKVAFPCGEVYLSYQVKFPPSFNWRKGGMLPGLWIGKRTAFDGDRTMNGSSVRIKWRANGGAEAYLYVGEQTRDFKREKGYAANGNLGESMWRGFLNFHKDGSWNNITLYVKTNTDVNYDGVLTVSLNDRIFTFGNLRWALTDDTRSINGIMMQTFFGGSDASWSTPVEQQVEFRNFVLNTPK